MFKFRGQKLGGEWVVGWYWYDNHLGHRVDELNGQTNIIDIHTLSISTYKLDSTGTEIFASFEVDGKMTEGGDVVYYGMGEGYDYAIKYSIEDGAFIASGHGNQTWQYVHELFEFPQYAVTIIGKQGGTK